MEKSHQIPIKICGNSKTLVRESLWSSQNAPTETTVVLLLMLLQIVIEINNLCFLLMHHELNI